MVYRTLLHSHLFNCTERRSWLYLGKKNVVRRLTHSPSLPFSFFCLCVHPIPAFIVHENNFHCASYAHAYSYGCALNYGLSSRRWIADRSHGTRSTLSALFSFLLFLFSIYSCPWERYTSRAAAPRAAATRGCKRGGFVPSGHGNGFERFLFANEGIVGSTL